MSVLVLICALLRSGMPRACVRDWIICVELWGGTRAPVRDRGVNAILVLPDRYHHFVSAKKEWHKRSVVCCLDWIAACLHAISL
jgi:hypothetical protein